ncbi:hypothetical protein PUN28_020708 [Cardiocondyla obscurior]|uniref:Uncharacterized protein n=1 Tax=Cardiocondyla obscurior TaxID=286306 RepID=A0AAW2EAD5_9HYME
MSSRSSAISFSAASNLRRRTSVSAAGESIIAVSTRVIKFVRHALVLQADSLRVLIKVPLRPFDVDATFNTRCISSRATAARLAPLLDLQQPNVLPGRRGTSTFAFPFSAERRCRIVIALHYNIRQIHG